MRAVIPTRFLIRTAAVLIMGLMVISGAAGQRPSDLESAEKFLIAAKLSRQAGISAGTGTQESLRDAIAKYSEALQLLREIGSRREEAAKAKPFVRDHPKQGPNDPCECGSGKKYKKCHGAGM